MESMKLSNEKLITGVLKLVQNERLNLLQVLDYLVEIERRLLYVESGHTSMFNFCTQELKFSSRQASSRNNASRLVNEFKFLRAFIQAGEIHLDTLDFVARVFKKHKVHKEVKIKVLKEIKGISKKKAEVIVYDMLNLDYSRMDRVKRVSKDKLEFTITISNQTLEKFRKVQKIRSHKMMTVGELFDYALETTLESIDPERKKIVRVKTKSNSRTPSANLKALVWKNASSTCQYPGCNEEHFLEVDHIRPIYRGGKTELSNLRLLCRLHNRIEAEKKVGVQIMGKYLKGRRGDIGANKLLYRQRKAP